MKHCVVPTHDLTNGDYSKWALPLCTMCDHGRLYKSHALHLASILTATVKSNEIPTVWQPFAINQQPNFASFTQTNIPTTSAVSYNQHIQQQHARTHTHRWADFTTHTRTTTPSHMHITCVDNPVLRHFYAVPPPHDESPPFRPHLAAHLPPRHPTTPPRRPAAPPFPPPTTSALPPPVSPPRNPIPAPHHPVPAPHDALRAHDPAPQPHSPAPPPHSPTARRRTTSRSRTSTQFCRPLALSCPQQHPPTHHLVLSPHSPAQLPQQVVALLLQVVAMALPRVRARSLMWPSKKGKLMHVADYAACYMTVCNVTALSSACNARV